MKNSTISVAIATFNEERNITDCLDSIRNLSTEVVIADGSSTDRTAQQAAKLGAKVIKTTNKEMFHINKNLAIDSCKEDWILLLDADERLSRKLIEEIKSTIGRNPKENAFWINRKNWFLGGFLTKGGAYPDRVIRLFKKGKARLPEASVHEQLKVQGEIGQLKNDIIHLADPTFTRYLERADRYTTLTANQISKQDSGRGFFQVIKSMIVKPISTFVNIYFMHKGYKDGFRGFIWALFSSAHHFYAYVKYWEKR